MHELIAWCGFLGGWLLVAGPVFQAALELAEEGFERDAVAGARSRAQDRVEAVSPWWWLLPPVGYYLARRRADRVRDAALRELDPDQRASVTSFMNKANGWIYVALGGSLIATKETWELCEAHEWSAAVFWVLAPSMALLCASSAAARMARTRELTA